MKKVISVLLAIFLFIGLFSACNQQENYSTAHSAIEDPAPSTILSPDSNFSTVPTAGKLTHIDIVNFINTFANRHNSGHASNITTKTGDNGETTYSFSYLDKLVSVEIKEKNGSIYQIGAYAIPSSMTGSTSINEAIIYCIKLIALAVLPCEPDFVDDPDSAVTWHSQQFATTSETTEDAITSEYTKANWKYSWFANNLSVAVCATILDDIPSGNTQSSSAQNANSAQLLEVSKGWKIDFVCEETEGTFHYAFEEDGTCYLVISDGLSPWGGGKGTYSVYGTCIIFSISMDGCRFDYSYAFDQQTNTLTHISGTPIFSGLAATGDKYKLEEDDANTVSKIKEMAQDFIDSYTDDGDI